MGVVAFVKNFTLLSAIPNRSDYRAVWDRFFHLSGMPLLVSAMKRWDDCSVFELLGLPVRVLSYFELLGLAVLSRLANHVSASHEAILEAGVVPWIQACLVRWPDHRMLNDHAWELVFALITRRNRAASDEVRLLVLENGMMPYLISFMSSSAFTTQNIKLHSALRQLLCDPSQHTTQIQQSFFSFGGLEVLTEVVRGGLLVEGDPSRVVLQSILRRLTRVPHTFATL